MVGPTSGFSEVVPAGPSKFSFFLMSDRLRSHLQPSHLSCTRSTMLSWARHPSVLGGSAFAGSSSGSNSNEVLGERVQVAGTSCGVPLRRREWMPPAKCSADSTSSDPLLVRAARKERVERPPAWMMRQAGRYMASYRKLTEKHPSFRERSENTDLIVEISLQPWKAFRPDGVIIFSDILTPLPAIGIPFEIDESKGPILDTPIRSEEGLKALHSIDLKKVNFVGESLSILRKEVGDGAAVLGFVGSPWTLATYIVEGATTRTYTKIKSMTHLQPELLRSILSHLANEIAEYVIFQVKAGAQCIQIFDSWGGQLPPHQWDQWSKPYIQQLVAKVRQGCPGVPLVLYANGNGGLLERMATLDVDVIGLDWTIDMADGRKRLGDSIAVQGNVDPAVLFAPLPAISEAVESVVRKAGNQGHILNLGHGVLVGTPEPSVAHFFDTARSLTYNTEATPQMATSVLS